MFRNCRIQDPLVVRDVRTNLPMTTPARAGRYLDTYTRDVLLLTYMIRSFGCQETRAIHEGFASRQFRSIQDQARKRLRWLNAATSLTDLGAIRGNRLEALKGDRDGQHSIRINDRWRICFSWRNGNAYDVEIVGYH